MKKLLTILLTTFMLLTLVGCNTNKEEPTILDEPTIQEETKEEEDTILGGFTEAEDKSLNDELIEIFNKACEGQVGISLTPERLEGTQVVAGINYKFLATGTKTTNPPIRGSYLVTIYKDLEGNCSITDIETVTESSGDVEGDAANYNYWVVFYNPDGNELQRTAQKLGTTPVYEGEEPYYWDIDYWYRFICWTDKEGNEIKEFTPITGNTYIYAKYEIGGENKPEPKESAPAPTPTPSHVCTKSSTYLLNITSVSLPSDIHADVYEWDSGNNKYLLIKGDYHIDGSGFNPIPMASGEWIHTNDYDAPFVGNQQYCDDNEAHEYACLAAGTMITMADGSRKPVESLQEGDDIRIFDHNTGKLSHAKIMDYWQYEEPVTGLMTLHFTNDIDVNIVAAHSFYNKQENKYITINRENINDYIGQQFYNADNDSWETLLGVNYSSKPVDTFFIATEDQYDCIAEGMLTMEDGIYTLVANIFDYDSNMKVNVVKKYIDIIKYGLFTPEDIPAIKENAIKAYKLQYIKVAIGKGIITEDIWNIMVKEMISYESDNVNEEYIPSKQKHSAK